MESKAYEEHLKEMTSSILIDDYSDEQIENIFNRLLDALPNNGKLYKYKSVSDDKTFTELYDSLSKGYIFLANPSSMNDDLDGTLYYDEESLEEASNYIRTHPHLLFRWLISKEKIDLFADPLYESLSNEDIKKISSFYNEKQIKIDEYRCIDYLTRKTQLQFEEAMEIVLQINSTIKSLYETFDKTSKEVIENFGKINSSKYRDMNKIFCLCTSFTNNSMWAKYANNKGVCIEYDYNLIKQMPVSIKRLMISIYKVIYSDVKPKHSFVSDLKYMLDDGISEKEMTKHNREAVISLITKETSWQNEDEWRIVLSVDEPKIYCDFVSKIYITDNLVGSSQYEAIKELASSHNWPLFIRKTNKNKTGFDYIKY